MAETSHVGSRMRAAMCCAFLLMSIPASAQQAAPAPPAPPTADDMRQEIERLRREFESVRDAYGARLTALEAKLAAMQGAAQAPPAPAGAAPVEPLNPVEPLAPMPAQAAAQAPAAPVPGAEATVPQGAAGAGGPEGSLPVYGGAASSKVFNPDMAVIGNFVGAAGRNTVDPAPALTLDEAEATFQAVVDPYARADFFFSFSPEGVEIEEGFLTFPTLPGGLLAKVGKFREQIGKVEHPSRACPAVGRSADRASRTSWAARKGFPTRASRSRS